MSGMQLAWGGKDSHILQIGELNISLYNIDNEEFNRRIEESVRRCLSESRDEQSSLLAHVLMDAARNCNSDYISSALITASRNVDLIPESALKALTIFELICEYKFIDKTLEEAVETYNYMFTLLLDGDELPSGLDWLDNLAVNGAMRLYRGMKGKPADMHEILDSNTFLNYTQSAHTLWDSHPTLNTITEWWNKIPCGFELTLAGIAIARCYAEIKIGLDAGIRGK